MTIAKSPLVAIIILNFNGWLDTIECLESIFQIDFKNFLVIVLDNGSIDDSIEKIKSYCNGEIIVNSPFFVYNKFKKPINFIEISKKQINSKENDFIDIRNREINLILINNGINEGFSVGNNIGISFLMKYFQPEYFLLLNNDVVVTKNFLTDLIEIAERESTIGILGPAIYHYHPCNQIQSAGVFITKYFGIMKTLTFNNELDKIPNILEVDCLSGCALLAKTQLIKDIGLLNPDYFAYWEETDWCIRAKKFGYKVIVLPKIKVWHKGGSTSKKIKGLTQYLMVRNRFWFMRTHRTNQYFWLFLVHFFLFSFWRDTISILLLQQNFSIYKLYIKGVKDGLKSKSSNQ